MPTRTSQAFCRHLCLEPLEDRRLLSFTVDTLLDEADGSIDDGDISLRDAIAAAVAGETIDFSVTGTINLTLGQLAIEKNLAIAGPGAEQLLIDASSNDPTPEEDNGDGIRVFLVDDGDTANRISVAISGLTLTGADAPFGGTLFINRERVDVAFSTISGNSATGA